jgi:hypothetical protein
VYRKAAEQMPVHDVPELVRDDRDDLVVVKRLEQRVVDENQAPLRKGFTLIARNARKAAR